jgi:hypothetical protein
MMHLPQMKLLLLLGLLQVDARTIELGIAIQIWRRWGEM